ncbi:hypothetical protein E4M02_01610 [Brevundimonas sp. S30B]|uniref:hypothetical protein n=1 Tax=unclassified Brevundimonas TaxID=2622653 RepID=UPI0010726DB9|nr:MULTISPECIES: hypothetical protein [unclassified Brevundimonas]QBX37401.1 hypothetical protein E4M01_06210 [Brevundimonas sp. MF30-B]TFW03806.1 hypothetical protein E4M02_01610 [Brevundimonas sp. S30B]
MGQADRYTPAGVSRRGYMAVLASISVVSVVTDKALINAHLWLSAPHSLAVSVAFFAAWLFVLARFRPVPPANRWLVLGTLALVISPIVSWLWGGWCLLVGDCEF